VDSRDNQLHYLYNKVLNSGSQDAQMELMQELKDRMRADSVFEAFVGSPLSEVEEFPLPRNFECLRAAVETYESACGKLSDYALKHVKHLVRACETESQQGILDRIATSCATTI